MFNVYFLSAKSCVHLKTAMWQDIDIKRSFRCYIALYNDTNMHKYISNEDCLGLKNSNIKNKQAISD